MSYSGYAIHVSPTTKDVGLSKLLEYLGVSRDEAVGIGDGDNDIEISNCVKLMFAVSNASDKLKRSVDYVLSRPSGEGFIELALSVLKAKGFDNEAEVIENLLREVQEKGAFFKELSAKR